MCKIDASTMGLDDLLRNRASSAVNTPSRAWGDRPTV
jgi:hypothetical protein